MSNSIQTSTPQQQQQQPTTTATTGIPTPSFFRISRAPESTRILTTPTPQIDRENEPQQTINLIMTLFQETKVHHPARLIYALAGRLFHPSSPIPFGGTRSSPGYLAFKGETPESLLRFIVSEAYRVSWMILNRVVLDFVVLHINHVLELHYRGVKDELDEWMMKGMKRAGHIEWFGAHYIPRQLRHVRESSVRVIPYSVEFRVRRAAGASKRASNPSRG
ncbi:hypothetical protein BDR26DRAFT_891053 [Obelidium mucronatum]|nr:hypothetical protein BDR26DRAFT_891053 [Obelidium mucronatum]